MALLSSFILVAIPAVIRRWETSGAFDALVFPEQGLVGVVTLVAGSALVLWAALALAISGNGTPLPFDAPRRLVVDGPYAWFRNPMATGAFVQGLGIGIARGSILLMIVFAVAALCWDLLVRPEDEDQLQRTFSRDYELYRRSVRCWLPLRRRWSPPPRTGPISLEELPERRRERRHRRGLPQVHFWRDPIAPPETDAGTEDA